MADDAAVTPLRFNDDGDGWHLAPPRRHLQRGLVALLVLALGSVAWGSARDGQVGTAIGMGAAVLFILAIALEPRPRKAPKMYEGPDVYGLLLPTHPVKISLIVLFALLGAALCVGPTLALLAGQGEGALVAQLAGLVFFLVLGILFVAGTVGGIESWRRPHRGVVLTVDGVRMQTQLKPATFAWHACHGLRAHWSRVRSGRNLFLTPDDLVANWLTFVVDPDAVDGPVPREISARTEEPTFNVKALALDPLLALEICRFYLDDAEARAELRTSAALDRVASIERLLAAPG